MFALLACRDKAWRLGAYRELAAVRAHPAGFLTRAKGLKAQPGIRPAAAGDGHSALLLGSVERRMAIQISAMQGGR